jgi:hypothetical protein
VHAELLEDVGPVALDGLLADHNLLLAGGHRASRGD